MIWLYEVAKSTTGLMYTSEGQHCLQNGLQLVGTTLHFVLHISGGAVP